MGNLRATIFVFLVWGALVALMAKSALDAAESLFPGTPKTFEEVMNGDR